MKIHAQRRSGLLGIGVLGLFLAVVPLESYAEEPEGSWSDRFNNLAWVSTGKKIRVDSIKSYDPVTRIANATVKFTDSFGNWYRRNINLKAALPKVVSLGRTCLASPVWCGAGVVATAVLIDQGIEFVNGQFYEIGSASGGSDYLSCTQIYHTFEEADGGTIRYRAPIPCMDQRYSSKWTIYSPQNGASLHEWATQVDTLTDWYSPEISSSPDYRPTFGLIYVYTRHFSATVPEEYPEAERTTASEAAVTDALMSDTAVWTSAGAYPDIWEPVAAEELANPTEEEAIDEPPLPTDPDVGQDWAGMDEVPQDVVDVSSYLDWGASWLPSQCPADYQANINVLGSVQPLTLEWRPICDATTTYVNPLLRVAGLLAFVGIVFRGKQGG